MAKIIHPPYTGHRPDFIVEFKHIVSLSVTMTVTFYKHKNGFFV